MKVVVVTRRYPERASTQNRRLKIRPVPNRVVTVDCDRLVGKQVQARRDRTSKSFDDGASAFVAAKHIGEVSDPLPDGVSREVVSHATMRDIARAWTYAAISRRMSCLASSTETRSARSSGSFMVCTSAVKRASINMPGQAARRRLWYAPNDHRPRGRWLGPGVARQIAWLCSHAWRARLWVVGSGPLPACGRLFGLSSFGAAPTRLTYGRAALGKGGSCLDDREERPSR